MGLIHNFLELIRFQTLDRSERNLVFYAESESYWGYLYPFIRCLVEEHNKSVCYLTSSSSDPVLDGKIPGIRPFFIHKGYIRTILFASGLGIVYAGLTITMAGVLMMLILFFNKPEHVLHPTWILFIGLGTVVWGEIKKARCK
jgi:hypothetical protein